jgi:hypothetical protein
MALAPETVQAILRAGQSPRAKRIEQFQKYVDGTIYDGRPDFLDDSSDKPITQRKPCVRYPGVANAIQTLATFCLGDGRFPIITSASSEDDSAFDERLGLNEEDSKTLDSGILKIVDQTRLEAVSKQILECAMAGKSVAVLACIQGGRLAVKHVDPKTAEPEFDEKDPTRVVRLTERYRYTTDELNRETGKWEPHVWQYKRVIDDKTDTVFEPIEILRDTEFPDPDKKKTVVKHGFGFCPVIWYRFRKQESTAGDIDGQAIHDRLFGLIEAIDIGLSQRRRAALYCGDPQVVETGVEDPAGVRAPSATVATQDMTRDASGYGEALIPSKRSGGMTTRKKGAGVVWQYDSPDADVKLLTLSGDALKTLVEDVDDNKCVLRESLGVVYVAPEDVTGSGDVSGKTLDVTYRPQIQVANSIREEFWRLCLLPLVSMLLRIVVKQEKGLYLGGADKIRAVAKRFEQEVDGAGTSWFDPNLKAKWGDYFEPSDQDESTRITNAQTALGGGDKPALITLATAVAHIKPIFADIQSVPQYVEKLKAEKAAKDAALHAAFGALGGMDGQQPGDDAKPSDPPKPGQPDNDNADGSGSGGGSAPAAPAAPAAKAAAPAPTAKAGVAAPAAKPAAPVTPAKTKAAPKQKVTGKTKPATAPKATQATASPTGKLTTVGADGATHELFGETDHMRAADESPGIAEKVYRDLSEDYSDKQLEWVKHASWRGPLIVPLSSIDWTKQFEWPANEDQDHIDDFVERIESDGFVKPIILVNEPNNDKLIIADGHHRALAYKKLGQNPMAYVANVGGVIQDGGDNDWRVMHDSQRGGSDQK